LKTVYTHLQEPRVPSYRPFAKLLLLEWWKNESGVDKESLKSSQNMFEFVFGSKICKLEKIYLGYRDDDESLYIHVGFIVEFCSARVVVHLY